MQLQESPVSRNPFYLMFRLGVTVQHLGQKLEQNAGLSLTQWAILKRLVDQPISTAQSLAESVGIQPATLTQALKRLERKRFIYLGKDRSDLRKKVLSVTRLGKETMDQADEWLNQKIQEHELGREDVQKLWEKLSQIT